jgi:hypothetical protein
MPESLQDRLPAIRTELAPFGEYGARFLSLGGRKASEDLFALAKQLLLLRGQGVPAPQPLSDKPLARWRKPQEEWIPRHDSFLLGGRQVAQAPEESKWTDGQRPRILAAAGGLRRERRCGSHLPLASKEGRRRKEQEQYDGS